VRLLLPVVRAVEAVHRAGLLHRDVTPARVLLEGRPDTPLEQCRPYLAGFGLARILDGDQRLSPSGAIGGAPGYQAPAPAQGTAVTPAADVWGLGVTLYQCLTGRLPFHGATPEETLRKAIAEPPAPPRSLVPDLDAGLEAACLRCLEKDPARRYPSAATLADDLERWLGEPTPAPGFFGRLWRRIRGR
jgi:serine/threonine-protein kinase